MENHKTLIPTTSEGAPIHDKDTHGCPLIRYHVVERGPNNQYWADPNRPTYPHSHADPPATRRLPM